MNNKHLLATIFKAITFTCATLVLVTSVIFLFSWHLGFLSVLKLPPTIALTSYASTVNLVLSGIALFFLFNPSRFPFVNICGGLILFIAFWRLAELTFDIKIGLAELVAPYIPLSEITTEKMPGVIVIGFLLIGMVFLCWSNEPIGSPQRTFFLLVSVIIMLLGMISTLNFIIPEKISFIWGSARLSFYAQILAILIGIGLISASLYDLPFQIMKVRGLAILITTLITLFTLGLSWHFTLERSNYLKEILKSRLDEIRWQMSTNIKDKINEIQLLSSQISENKSLTNELNFYSWVQKQKELRAIFLVDSKMILRRVISTKNVSKNLNEPFNFPENLKKLIPDYIKHKKMFFVLDKDNTKYNLLIINPVYWDKNFQGFVIFVIGIKELLENKLSKNLIDNFEISLQKNGTTLYENKATGNHNENLEFNENLHFKNLDFSIKIYPSLEAQKVYIHWKFIYWTLIGGIITALSLGTLTHLWQLAHAKISEVEKFQTELLLSQNELKEALESAQMGTWSLDLKTEKVDWDAYHHKLFGLKPEEFNGELQSALNFLIPIDKARIQEYFKHCIETQTPIDCSYRVMWPDESLHWLVSKGKFFLDKDGTPYKITGFSWDISSIKRAHQQLEVSETISKILSANAPIKNTFNDIIQILHHYLSWSVMVVWFLDQESKNIQLSEIAHIPEINIFEFERATRNLKINIGMALPGLILSTHRPVWAKDITLAPDFERHAEAAQAELKGYFAFPILEGTQVIGIIELFRQMPFVEEVDEGWLNLVTSVGISIGQYLKRRSSNKELLELAAIVTSAHEGIYSLNTDGTIMSWNEGAERLFGWTASEAIGKPITITYPKERLNEWEFIKQKVLLGHSIEHFETQAVKKNGTIIWVDKAITGIRDENGKIYSMSTIIQDISVEKEMIYALSASEKKFRDFVETTEEWFWAIDTELKFTYSNPIVEKILGYSHEEIISKEMLTLISPDARSNIEMLMKHCIRNKEGWRKRITPWVHKDGSIKWLESNAHPILSKENNITGFRGADRDVTEIRLIEKSKNEFISMVNHELRTPLTSILGSLGIMLTDPSMTDKLKELTEIAYRNSERLTKIINDILDIEKFELGKFEFDIKPISIVDVVDEGIKAFSPSAKKLNIQIVNESASFENVKVLADHGRLIQVLMNLLSNALKFSPPDSSIFVSIQPMDTKVRVSVRDEGPGIPEEFKAKVFQRFAQADASDSRSVSGTGLGLNISKSLIEGMHGTISFISKKNNGTTFYFDLQRWVE